MANEIKTLADVPAHFGIGWDSQEIESARQDFPSIPVDATVVVVNVENGDYKEVYYGDSSRPYLSDTQLYKVK